jgi:predicted phage terminase large subunit-like protein
MPPPRLEIRWSKYIPKEIKPTPKQLLALLCNELELFWGGSVGGGKSQFLLMSALQFCDVPGYSALLIRKNLTDMQLSNSILDRAQQWLNKSIHPDIKYRGDTRTFLFPTKMANGEPGLPSKLTFGFLNKTKAEYRYQGTEWNFIGFDEVTQFSVDDYTYMFSRLRKCFCPYHKEDNVQGVYHDNCAICKNQASVPLRMRAASNPGNESHQAFKERFDIRKDPATGMFRGFSKERVFIPASWKDNPHLNHEEYKKGLEQMHPVVREQLMNGNWDVQESARFKRQWAKYYSFRSEYLVLGKDGIGQSVHMGQLGTVFCTMDPALSSKDYAGKDAKKSWCVISTWAITPSHDLVLLNVNRFKKELPDLLKIASEVQMQYKPDYWVIESNNLGNTIIQLLSANGFTCRGVPSVTDKVARSVQAAVRMEQGKVWFPQQAPWLDTFEGELYTWTGDEDEVADQIDTFSLAAKELTWDAFSQNRAIMENNQGIASSPYVVPLGVPTYSATESYPSW